jgi:hypothetical protein
MILQHYSEGRVLTRLAEKCIVGGDTVCAEE